LHSIDHVIQKQSYKIRYMQVEYLSWPIKLNNIKEKHINLNVKYYQQFIHADINAIKFTFIIYVVM